MTFSQYWQKAKIAPELQNLTQKQIDALRRMMTNAYRAGIKAARTTT